MLLAITCYLCFFMQYKWKSDLSTAPMTVLLHLGAGCSLGENLQL